MEKITGGYYIKARKIQQSEIAHCSPAVREIWDWLLMNANHKPSKDGRIKRGQLLRSYEDIREGLKWYVGYRTMRYSEDVTKKAMKALRRHLMISTMKAPGGVLITICNYDNYQDQKNYESTYEGTNEGTTKAPGWHQGGTIYNNKNVKNVKNERSKKKKIPELSEFLSYAEKSCKKANVGYKGLKFAIESKYQFWKDADWKDGNGKVIENWKNKFNNTLPYLRPIQNEQKGNIGTKEDFGNKTGRIDL